ncbi:hypothetical protein BV898_02138 [Hypsibius exemplaris]|uniref:Uncharacterized protein n=1 Tax=Hypsibius exemplaris TaxID=2072580 RepID=A0A1W0XA94_HYPEX|nr:hypothetical protein BV898_02138 [Hypsibius exemplaris]
MVSKCISMNQFIIPTTSDANLSFVDTVHVATRAFQPNDPPGPGIDAHSVSSTSTDVLLQQNSTIHNIQVAIEAGSTSSQYPVLASPSMSSANPVLLDKTRNEPKTVANGGTRCVKKRRSGSINSSTKSKSRSCGICENRSGGLVPCSLNEVCRRWICTPCCLKSMTSAQWEQRQTAVDYHLPESPYYVICSSVHEKKKP